jgi:predicted HAD superfamily Cof-like phosphohydrolase
MTQLHDDVEAFQKMIGFEAPPFPQAATAEVMRQKLRVFMEEAFEAIEATVFRDAIIHDGTGHTWGDRVREFKNHCLSRIVDKMPVAVDLDGLIDACADIDYTCEGLRQAIGVHDAEPYADEVQRANMDKRGGHLDANGKWRKPEGWRPPDIRGIRERQVAEYWDRVRRESDNAARLAFIDAAMVAEPT